MIEKHDIAWWAKQLEQPFSLARFGDGEFLCVAGRSGGNSHGCAYTPQLKDDLVAILEDTSTNFLKGLQRLETWQHEQIKHYCNVGRWVDTEIFADALAAGELKPFFDALRKKPIMLVSSGEKRKAADFLPIKHFVETPRTNAHAEKDFILHEVMKYAGPGAVILFACGMAAGTFVHALHGKIPGATLIDIGHILDPFIGEASRDYLVNMDEDILMKNIL